MKFKTAKDTLYAVDLKGIAVSSQENINTFIHYPEAAVWLVLVQNYPEEKTLKMLASILGKDEINTGKFINKCLQSWREASMIE